MTEYNVLIIADYHTKEFLSGDIVESSCNEPVKAKQMLWDWFESNAKHAVKMFDSSRLFRVFRVENVPNNADPYEIYHADEIENDEGELDHNWYPCQCIGTLDYNHSVQFKPRAM